MIPSVEEKDDEIGIPIYGTDQYCWIKWKEDQTPEEAIGQLFPHGYLLQKEHSFEICPTDLDIDNDEDDNMETFVYLVKDHRTLKKYYMLTEGQLYEYEDAYHSVCVPYNRFNLLKFYTEYLCTIGQTVYRSS